MERLKNWVRRHPIRIAGIGPLTLLSRAYQRFTRVRGMGLAAEMTYYAILSLFPLLSTLGASLGFLERLIGAAETHRVQMAVVDTMEAVFTPEVTADVIAPLVAGLLQQERIGFALSSFLISLFFASRVFRSLTDALDNAYEREERHGIIALWVRGFMFSVMAVVMATVLLVILVVGPLLGGGQNIADIFGLGPAFELTWTLARWPTVLALAALFLSSIYHFGPKAPLPWRHSVLGSVVGVAGIILVTLGFRLYIDLTGLATPAISDPSEAVAIAVQLVGALVAILFWLWLSSLVILVGGVLNAEVNHAARRREAT